MTQDDMLLDNQQDDDMGNDEILAIDREAEAEDRFSDPVGSREAGDELIDENEWQARELEEAIEGADDDIPYGFRVVDTDQDGMYADEDTL